MSRPRSYLESFLADLDPLILASPVNGALTDLGPSAYAGSLAGGATVTEDTLAPGQVGALSLTGSAYGSFAAPTRRNGVKNPGGELVSGSYGTNGAYWDDLVIGNNSISQQADPRPGSGGSYSVQAPFDGTSRTLGAMRATRNGQQAADGLPCVAGQTVIGRAWHKIHSVGSGSVTGVKTQVRFLDAALTLLAAHDLATQTNPVTGTWYEQVGISPAAPANTALAVLVTRWDGTAATNVLHRVDDALLEIVPAGAVAASYPHFDATGYVNASGVWVPSAGIECGALGTLHASASDKGPLGNGKTITVVGLAQVSADAANGVGQTLFGSDLSTNGTRLDLYNSGGTRQARLQIGGTTYTWTLTAAEIAATGAGQDLACRLEFAETANTATLQFNGLPAVAKSSVTAQHAAGQTTVQLGAYASGSSPLPGKLGIFGLYPRAFTTTEARMWETIVEHGGPFRIRRRR